MKTKRGQRTFAVESCRRNASNTVSMFREKKGGGGWEERGVRALYPCAGGKERGRASSNVTESKDTMRLFVRSSEGDMTRLRGHTIEPKRGGTPETTPWNLKVLKQKRGRKSSSPPKQHGIEVGYLLCIYPSFFNGGRRMVGE